MSRGCAARLFLALAIGLGLAAEAVDGGEPLRLGVLEVLEAEPQRDPERDYRPLAAYLSRRLGGRPVVVRHLGYGENEIEDALARNELDFLLTNPSHFTRLRARNSFAGVIATLEPMVLGKPQSALAGAIVVATGAGAPQSLAELAGRRIAAVDPRSLGGFQAQALELHDAGVRSLRQVSFLATHGAALKALVEGRADVAFVRAGALEYLIAEGRIPPDRLRVLNPQPFAGLPYGVSTRLYPQWPVVALPHVDRQTVRRISAALLELSPDHPAARAARISGFQPPADYTSVERMARTLRLPPFDTAQEVTLTAIWRRYTWQVVLGLAGLALVLLLALRITLVNRALHRARVATEARSRALDASDKRLRAIYDNAAIAIGRADLYGRLEDVNQAFAELLGYEPDELYGMPFGAITHPEDRERDQVLHEALAAGARDRIQVETRWVRKTGDPVWVSLAVHRVPDPVTGAPLYFGIALDTTDRHRAVDVLSEMNAQLERRVAQEVDRSMASERALIHQSRLAAMGEMIGNIAHQWRQPLNALSLVLGNLRDAGRSGPVPEPQLEVTLEQAGRLIQQMSTTIRDFMDFFRPDRAAVAFPVRAKAQEAMALVAASFDHSGIRLELEPGPEVRSLGFPNEYAQVLLNLLSNAREAIKDRRVAQGWVRVAVAAEAGRCVTTVLDNGGGISGEALGRVFEPYFSTKAKGTGLGLYMARRIAETGLGGSLECRNQDGGAAFILTTPLAEGSDGT